MSKTTNDGSRRIRLYTYENSNPVLIYEYDSNKNNAVVIYPGIEIVKFEKSNSLPGYAMIDWNTIPDNTTMSSMLGSSYILSDKCYDIKNMPMLSEALFWENNYEGKRLDVNQIFAGEVIGNVYEIPHNYDVPVNKNAMYISSDIEQAYETTTDELRKRSLIPYIYFNGKKVGSFVLLDSNGDPYIIDQNGNVRRLAVQEGEN